MSADELVAIGERTFGRWGWQRRLAEALEMNENTVRRWKTGDWPVNEGMAARIRALGAGNAASPPARHPLGRAGLLRLALLAGGGASLVEREGEMGLEALDGSWQAWETDEDSMHCALERLGST